MDIGRRIHQLGVEFLRIQPELCGDGGCNRMLIMHVAKLYAYLIDRLVSCQEVTGAVVYLPALGVVSREHPGKSGSLVFEDGRLRAVLDPYDLQDNGNADKPQDASEKQRTPCVALSH